LLFLIVFLTKFEKMNGLVAPGMSESRGRETPEMVHAKIFEFDILGYGD
jgi:hypothetical protein